MSLSRDLYKTAQAVSFIEAAQKGRLPQRINTYAKYRLLFQFLRKIGF